MSGKLLMNSLVMDDRETDSLWSQFAGEAVSGSLDGAKLEIVPSQLTPWVDWKRQYPDTLVLEKVDFDASGDGYFGYYLSGSAGESTQRVYAIRDLRKVWVVNDTFEDSDIVVMITNGGATTTVYSRTVGDRSLSFEQAESELQMTDQ